MSFKNLAISAIFAISSTSLLADTKANANAQKPLLEVLQELAKRADLALSIAPNLAKGKSAQTLPNTQSLSNVQEIQEALSKTLANSDLRAKIENGTIIITKENVSLLQKVSMQASSDHSEDSNSYAMAKMRSATGMRLSTKETPQSISVITRQRIEDEQLSTITDVANSVTGVSAKSIDSARSAFASRGFRIDNLQIDGVPRTWEASWASGEGMVDVAIYDRVEVVRGATGLMTGAGNPSASINMVRKRANFTDTHGSITLNGGSWSDYRGIVDVGSKLIESGKVRGRFVGSYQERESFIERAKDMQGLFYGTLEVDLTQNTLLSFGVSHQDNDHRGATWGSLPAFDSNNDYISWDRKKSTSANWSKYDIINTNYFLDITQQLANEWEARAVFSSMNGKSNSRLLYIYGAMDRATGKGLRAGAGRYDVKRDQDSFTLQADGPIEILGRKHELILGAQYSKQDFKAYSHGYIGGTIDNFYTFSGNYIEPTWEARTLSEKWITKQKAIYGAVRVSLLDSLHLILGGRLSTWERDGSSYGDRFLHKHTNVFTPYAGIIYDVTDDISVYASYTDIFNPQNARNSSGEYLDPLTGETYEGGIKGEFFGGRLNTGFTFYRINQDNLAQSDAPNLIPGTTTFASKAAKGTQAKGYELDISGEVTKEWSLAFGYSHIFSAKEANGMPVNTQYPQKSIKLFTTYKILQSLTLGGGANWESASYQGKRVQKAYTLVNLMARYDVTKDISAQLNINNLFDEKYHSGGFAAGYNYGKPRNTMLTAKYNF